jgi:tripartite-type tricarboxylate transporter receptor subunit TctC
MDRARDRAVAQNHTGHAVKTFRALLCPLSLTGSVLAFTALMTAHAPMAAPDAVADFYKGKTITIVVGSDSGGGYDLNARVLGRYLGRYIPGNPNIIVQNKPGASSLLAANYVYEIAPKDGTVIAEVQRPIPFPALFVGNGARYDVRKIQWLGSTMNEMGLIVAWNTAPQHSIADVIATPMVIGGNGPATDTEIFPRALNSILGTQFKIVSGYPGQAQITLAMERGEIQGTGNWSWSDIQMGHADWLSDKKIRLLLQLDLKKNPDLPDVPLILDLARNSEERQVFEMLASMKALGRPYFVAPEVPQDRADALRTAFMQTMKDPDFLADAKKSLGKIDPVSGADMKEVVTRVNSLPAAITEKARDAIKQ